MLSCAVIACCVLAVFLLFGQELPQTKPIAAVMDLAAEQGVSASAARMLSDSLRRALFKAGQFEIVSRENMKEILTEQKFWEACTSQQCILDAGKLLGAKKMFAGTIGRVGGTYLMVVKMVDVESGKFEKAEEDRCAGCAEDALLDMVDRVAARLCGTTPPEPGTAVSGSRPKTITGKDGMTMVLVPAGEFEMGSPAGEGEDDEHPRHTVYLDAYYIDEHEVTVAQYRKFCEETGRKMPSAPGWGWHDDHPVVNVTWDDASAYARYYGKRLPTEAEWEKACRAGSTTRYCYGDDDTRLGEYAWYGRNSGNQTHPVKEKKPNGWGLYDMYGNVWEWCADWYGEEYYKTSPKNNPTGPSSGDFRVVRGGSWNYPANNCRSADRLWGDPPFGFDHVGFRCASSAVR